MSFETSESFSAAEKAALSYARAIGPVPAVDMNTEIRVQLARHFSVADEELVVLAVSMAGFLNRCMDALGVPLEFQALLNGDTFLAESGWKPGKHVQPKDSERLLQEKEAQMREVNEERGVLSGASKWVSLVSSMASAALSDAKSKRHIPTKPKDFETFFVHEIGFCPYYFEKRGPNARRAMAQAFLQMFHAKTTELHIWFKYVMCYVLAVRAKNTLLESHFAFLSIRFGTGLFLHCRDLIAAKEQRWDDLSSVFDRRAVVLLQFIWTLGSSEDEAPCRLTTEVTKLYSPQSVMDAVGVASVFTMFQRLTSTYPAMAYEPAVGEFVASRDGVELGLSPQPGAIDTLRWDEIAAAVRGSGGATTTKPSKPSMDTLLVQRQRMGVLGKRRAQASTGSSSVEDSGSTGGGTAAQ